MSPIKYKCPDLSLIHSHQYTNNFRNRDPEVKDHKILFAGNNAKSLKLSFKESLKRLRTDYIDLLYVHWWDWDTSIEEVMRALHHLVASGQVLYLVSRSSTVADVLMLKANRTLGHFGYTCLGGC